MKKALITLLAVLALATPAFAQGQHYVHPYTRSNGTSVQGHYQTNPDGNFQNNWSTMGNVNPYTGQQGYRTQPAPYIYNYNNGNGQGSY